MGKHTKSLLGILVAGSMLLTVSSGCESLEKRFSPGTQEAVGKTIQDAAPLLNAIPVAGPIVATLVGLLGGDMRRRAVERKKLAGVVGAIEKAKQEEGGVIDFRNDATKKLIVEAMGHSTALVVDQIRAKMKSEAPDV